MSAPNEQKTDVTTGTSDPPGKAAAAAVASHFSSEVISIVLGEGDNKTTLMAHKGLLCAHSAFFSKALKKDFKEARERKVQFPDDDDVYTFSKYLAWLYSHDLDGRSGKASRCDLPYASGPQHKSTGHLLALAKMWILGDRLQDAEFQEFAIGAMVHCYHEHAWDKSDECHKIPSMEDLTFIWTNTTPVSELRYLVVDMLACSRDVQSTDEVLQHIPEDMAREVAMASVLHSKHLWQDTAERTKEPLNKYYDWACD